MSSERLELARRLRSAWSTFVADEIVRCYSPDAELVSGKNELFGGVYRGHEGLRRYIGEFCTAFEAPTFEVEELFEAGESVVEVVHVTARGRRSRAEVHDRTPVSTRCAPRLS